MTFFLQASHPAVVRAERPEGGDLSSAVSRVFEENTEDAVLVWSYVPILLSYNGNLSEIMPEVLDMLEACLAAPQGEQLVRFGSSSFRAHWQLRWSAGQLAIHARWSSVRGRYEDLLNQRAELALPLADFLAEWKAVLAIILGAIDASGVRLDPGDDRLDRLRAVEAALPRYGLRYPAGPQRP
jgi:hypothetical protein